MMKHTMNAHKDTGKAAEIVGNLDKNTEKSAPFIGVRLSQYWICTEQRTLNTEHRELDTFGFRSFSSHLKNNAEPRRENREHRTKNTKQRTQNRELRTENTEQRTQKTEHKINQHPLKCVAYNVCFSSDWRVIDD